MKEAKIALTLMAALAMASAYALPRNSYLIRPARTQGELMTQIKSEPIVADRFMRHFGMNRTEMIEFVGSLKLGRLDKTAVHMIYGVPKNGQLHATPQLLKRGTLVWEDSAGEPILLEICGNPFTQGPKRTTMNDLVTATPTEAAPLVAMSTLPTEPVSSAPVAMAMQPVTPTAPMPIDPIVGPASVSRNNYGWLLILPAAAAFGFNGGGGDDPVPEPASMTAMAVGAGFMALKRRKVAKKS